MTHPRLAAARVHPDMTTLEGAGICLHELRTTPSGSRLGSCLWPSVPPTAFRNRTRARLGHHWHRADGYRVGVAKLSRS